MRTSPSANSQTILPTASSQALIVTLTATRLSRIRDAARALPVLTQATFAAAIAPRWPHRAVSLVLHLESG
jgi:hypothetical protein